MSFTALRAAFNHIMVTPMSAPARLVLLALANRHNQETGRCDPSNATIAKDTQLSERAVRQGTRELELLKLIVTVERKQRTGRGKLNLTNRYKLKGGAQFAGRMGQDMPPNLNTSPSAFDELAMLLEDPSQDGAQR